MQFSVSTVVGTIDPGSYLKGIGLYSSLLCVYKLYVDVLAVIITWLTGILYFNWSVEVYWD